MSPERVFIVGGTGNIGEKTVHDLLANNVPVTLYARNPEKVKSTFTVKSELISIVQGDYNDLSPLKKGVEGHTRLFLLIADFGVFVKTKQTIAEYAYAAGVKQIVDISSFTVNGGWRSSFIGSNHYLAERAIFEIPNRGAFVALRPGKFMSNLHSMARIATEGVLYDTDPADKPQTWISTNDIGAVAAVILQEDIQKHGDNTYTLNSDIATPAQVAAIISRLLGREIPFKQLSSAEHYHKLVGHHVPHSLAFDLCDNLKSIEETRVGAAVEVLTGRKPETLEEYLTANKHLIK
ncbi:uncharacterized protein B0P05DRAFT_480984 [Gilbertella persicaria]|uniref:uncharacterized protein n=1 Tax=Gilbertella persicaria TaxID=101096 RepID=UPI00221E46C2|nr:uncharacterized protein B0P05DRAFT_480984 [Gilbertella persicaria]KAI8048592.1 hypothetical protein B0P05DRAFT_480984 [Gilbertella persicaria]